MAAFKQVAFNWTAYFRALDRTRPLAVNGALSVATFLVVGIPGMLMYGLTGFAVASIASEAVALATRTWYLHRLFEHFNVLRHCLRAVAPTLPGGGGGAAACARWSRASAPGRWSWARWCCSWRSTPRRCG